MQSQAQVRTAIVDLAGPLPAGVSPSQADTARRTLSWCLGQYGDLPFKEAVLGVRSTGAETQPSTPTSGGTTSAPPPPTT